MENYTIKNFPSMSTAAMASLALTASLAGGDRERRYRPRPKNRKWGNNWKVRKKKKSR